MAENLRPEGIPVTIGTVRISTPGLTGRVEVYQPGTAGMRGAESSTEAFRRALDDAGVVEQLTVEITGQRELDSAGGSRGGGGGSEIVVEVPPPGTGNGQLLLYAAEDGSLSWHLPDDVPPDQVVSRGGDRRTYRLPREVVLADPASAGGQRGILGAVGSKLFKILVFPAHRPDPGKGRRLLRRPVGAEEPAQPRAVVRPGRLPARRRRGVRGAGLDAGERRHRAPVHPRHDRTVQHGVRPAAGRDPDGARTSLPRKGFRARPLHDLGDAARQREVAGRAAHGAGWRFSAHPRHREPLPWWPRRSGARRTGGRRRAVRQGHGAQLRHGGVAQRRARPSPTRRTCRS